METVIIPELNKDDLSKFKTALQEQYWQKKSPKLALAWAYHKIRNSERYFPKVVLTGERVGYPVVDENYIGTFAYIQPGELIFFLGDDLLWKDRQCLCGNATLSVNKDTRNLLSVIFNDFSISAHIIQEAEIKYFYLQAGYGCDAYAERYYITDGVFEKIKSLYLKGVCLMD